MPKLTEDSRPPHHCACDTEEPDRASGLRGQPASRSGGWVACFLFGILTGSILPASRAADMSQQERTMLSAIRTAYEANRASFQWWTISFSFMSGKAMSVAEARTRQFMPDAFDAADGTCLFDGSQLRYECVFNPVNGKLPTRLPSVRILRREGLVLFDTLLPGKNTQKPHHHPSILNATNILVSVIHLPLELGVPEEPNYNLARDIDESLATPSRLPLKALRPAAELEHVPVVEVTFTAHGVDRTYWIDLRRGAMPLQVRDVEAMVDRFSETTTTFALSRVRGGCRSNQRSSCRTASASMSRFATWTPKRLPAPTGSRSSFRIL
jgi:hypothetical protein